MDVRSDLMHALLSGFDDDTRSGLLDRMESARQEQIRAKRESGSADEG
jgi:hypothetical protein